MSSPSVIPGSLNKPQTGDHDVARVYMALVPASPPANWKIA